MISVEFIFDDLPDGQALDIQEDRGRVVFRIGRHLDKEQIPGVLTEGASSVVAGGHWFQEWKGEIIAAEPDEVTRRLPLQRRLRNVNRPDSAAS